MESPDLEWQRPATTGAPDSSPTGMLSHRVYRQVLDSAVRFHTVAGMDALVKTIVDVLSPLVQAESGVVAIHAAVGETVYYAFPAKDGGRASERGLPASVKLHLDRVMSAGLPILDGPGATRGVGIPLAAGSTVLGAVQLQMGASAARLGTATLDLLVLLGRHAAVALVRIVHPMAGGAPANGDLLAGDLSLREARRTFEGRLVASRLAVSRGNIAAAARSLDMDRGQLSRLLKRHGVDKQAYREAH